ncbi:DUF2062 domain-containing protein [candidate division CSSED10-310 bacterium]|uniref:DUF2062 domain-containing protein n=1 Tax=candidate division CSSED10-310 bacterium TaxID=2855610 RepID=A0ABV6YWW3_UNCC1
MEQKEPKSCLKRYFFRTYSRFLKIRGNPREVALGFALGLFIGMSPTLGIQMPLAIFIAALLKWNKISAASGVWITNPITAPFIYSATYFIGSKVLELRKSFIPPDEFSFSTLLLMINKAPFILFSLCIGGIILGIPLAILGYYLSFFALKRYQGKITLSVRRKKEALARKKKKMKERLRNRKKQPKKRS